MQAAWAHFLVGLRNMTDDDLKAPFAHPRTFNPVHQLVDNA